MKIITLLVTASLIGIVAKAHPEAAPEADPNPQIDFTAQVWSKTTYAFMPTKLWLVLRSGWMWASETASSMA